MAGSGDEAAAMRETVTERRGRRHVWWAAGAVVLLGLGALGGVALTEWRHGRARPATAAAPVPADTAASPSASGHAGHGGPSARAAGPPSDEPIEVSIAPDALRRAGIATAEVRSDETRDTLVAPATVTSNAYRDTKVSALVGGVVRQVRVELGAMVRRGQPLAVVFSGELAEAQMKYLSMRASYEADHLKFDRTQRLTELGAASRQELEEVTAQHNAHETELEAARQRLVLLGLSAEQIDRLTSASNIVSERAVPSPVAGTVIARAVNPGQVVAAGQELFVVTDLDTVWVIGDIYERDFARVRVGSAATVSAPAAPDRHLHGRVAYIDPRVDPVTRTAKVRVEVPNRDGRLRLGMFVQVALDAGGGERRAQVPRAAVQSIGARTVVYVATEEEGRFVERPVRLGDTGGDPIEVLEGLRAGERVVTDGSFFVRSEAARAR